MSLSSPAQGGLGSSWLRRVELIDRFEIQWQSRGEARIAEFVAQVTATERTALLLELVKIDLEYRWRKGDRPRVEQYASEFPELGEPAALPVELIAEEIHVRSALGDPPSDEELAERFPGRVTELNSLRASANDPCEEKPEARAKCRGTEAAGSKQSFAGASGFSGPAQQPVDDRASSAPSSPPATSSNSSATPLYDPPTGTLTGAPTDLVRKPAAESPGRLGKYELREQVGRGGFAVVYRAWDPELRREVAIKIPRPELLEHPDANARVMREARSAARLRHPAIVPIHEIGDASGTPFIVYEYIAGPTMQELLKQTNPAPLQAAAWVARIAEALDYAHQAGIVHRDVKPANVMMDRNGEPVIADFGLAMQADAGATLTQEGDILGTPAYMSPEQARGEGHQADARSDVYALGALLYEMLCGRRVFEGSGASVLYKVIHEEPPPPRGLKPSIALDLETICLKAMAKEPARRYATAGAMADDLRRFLKHEPIRARRIGPIGRLVLWCRRKPALAATITLAVSVSLTVASVSFWRVLQERDRAVTNLYHSLVREARAIRLARSAGYRAEAWARLDQARRLNTIERNVEELRNEAAAGLGDFVGLEPAVWSDFGDDYNRWAVALAISPNGKLVAVGTMPSAGGAGGGLVLLRDAATGADVARLEGHRSGVFEIQFSPDSHTAVSADDTGVIKVWGENDSNGWICSRTITIAASEGRNFVRAISLAITPDGKRLLASSKGETSVSMWGLDDGSLVGRFTGDAEEKLERMALSPDGSLLVGLQRAGRSSHILVWNLKTTERLRTVSLELDSPNDIIFSVDGQLLACTSMGAVELLSTAEFQRQMSVRGDAAYSAAFSPDGRLLAIPSHELNVIRLWDTTSNREIAVLQHSEDHPHAVSFSRDGTTLVSMAAKSVRVWNLAGGGEKTILAGHSRNIHDVAFHPGGMRLASASDDRTVCIWDAATGRLCRALPDFNNSVRCVQFSPDGQLMATGDESGGVRIWSTSSPDEPSELATLDVDLGPIVQTIAFSPDGNYLGVAADGGVGLWRIVRDSIAPSESTSDRRAVPHASVSFEFAARPFDNFAGSLCFSPKGTLLAWAHPTLHLWDIEQSRPILAPSAGADVPHDLTFDRDGTHLVFVHYPSGVLESWDVASGQRTGVFDQPNLSGERSTFLSNTIALSSDGAWLARAGSRVAVWDSATRRSIIALGEERSTPQCIAWSRNREQLAIGSADGSLVIWNMPEVRSQLGTIGLAW